VVLFGGLFGGWGFGVVMGGFNIHRAVECISINFIIIVWYLK
jgi:hypothetical protein